MRLQRLGSSAAALILLLGACARDAPEPEMQPTERVVAVQRVPLDPRDPGLINPARLSSLAPRIRSIRVIPEQIHLRVGDTFRGDQLQVVVYDSAGERLGRLPIWDRGMQPGAATMDENENIHARRRGTAMLRVAVPMWERSGGVGAVPEITVPVHVR